MGKIKELSLDDSYFNDFSLDKPCFSKTRSKPEWSDTSEVLKRSVIADGLGIQDRVINNNKSTRKCKKERKAQREKTKGAQWFNLPATSLTPEIENDLKIIKMRSVLDPKQFYKKNDMKVLPKYFELGTVIDSPVDYYNNRVPKKERKKTIVDELLADAEFHLRSKKKYNEIMAQRSRTHYKAHRIAKRLKKLKKH